VAAIVTAGGGAIQIEILIDHAARRAGAAHQQLPMVS